MIPIVCVVGYSNSGKTTLVVKLVTELKARGFRVATIKHHHKTIAMDVPGKDTFRHAEAGADVVVLATPGGITMMERTPTELKLEEIAGRVTGVDIIVAEGFKHAAGPKIEVFRSEVHDRLITPPEELLAVASDVKFQDIPVFGLDDSYGLVNYLLEKLSL